MRKILQLANKVKAQYMKFFSRKSKTTSLPKLATMSPKEIAAFHQTSFPTMTWREFCQVGYQTANNWSQEGRNREADLLRAAVARAEDPALR